MKIQKRGQIACHKMIAKTAKGMAGAFYEDCCSRNVDFYRANPNANVYIRSAWPAFIEVARSTLAGMLAMNYPEPLKEEILDALVKDASLGRKKV